MSPDHWFYPFLSIPLANVPQSRLSTELPVSISANFFEIPGFSNSVSRFRLT